MGIIEMGHAERGARSAGEQSVGAGVGSSDLTPADQVSTLYRLHGMDLVRIAAVMLGSRAAAEDAVQEAFAGLYRRWDHLADSQSALPYVRSAVMNRCRTELRRRARLQRRADQNLRPIDAETPEQAAILGEEHRDVVAALRRLPARQRESLILRYFMDLSESEAAAAMGISQGTVKSTTSRALVALARQLKEPS